MKKIIMLVIMGFLLTGCFDKIKEDIKKPIKKSLIIASEYAYLQGQVDAINKIIKVNKDKDNNYFFISSPWEDDETLLLKNIKFKFDNKGKAIEPEYHQFLLKKVLEEK